jgi:hypothetical protein
MTKKKKPINVASRKAKGRRLQSQIATKLSKLLGIPFEKDGDIDVRIMGDSGSDIILRGDAKGFYFDGIEAKNQERIQIWQALEQASQYGKKPLLFFKRNRSKTYVVMEDKDFYKLYEAAKDKI